MFVTVDGAYSLSLNTFLLNGHTPDTEKPFIIFIGVAAFTRALEVIEGKSYIVNLLPGLLFIQESISWLINFLNGPNTDLSKG